jgi:hypothetical protein
VTAVHAQRWNQPPEVRTALRTLGRRQGPLDHDELRMVLRKLHKWEAFDGGALLDDVAVVLDDVTPAEEDLDDLILRLRNHLSRLVAIARAAEAGEKDAETGRLITRAGELRATEMPGDHLAAVGHLRKTAWCVNELLERLAVTGCLKEAA